MNTPKEIDTKLAELYTELYRLQDRFASTESSILHAAGASFYYRGRQRVTDMQVDEALEILKQDAAYIEAYKAEHGYTEPRDYGEYHGTNWDAYEGRVAIHEHRRPAELLEKLEALALELGELHTEIVKLEQLYTGWSRFFLVTSSAGHVHSSMHCSTCRPTTRYGWLPELSGKTEAVAVDELGPTLCTVCFPSAPVEYTEGKKLTAAQAAKRAA